uniref:Uncharacterized protein n=1 Tax=Caenorhabditis japonica TaxID=281687 RepID=A0A8R1HIN1_CAEJA
MPVYLCPIGFMAEWLALLFFKRATPVRFFWWSKLFCVVPYLTFHADPHPHPDLLSLAHHPPNPKLSVAKIRCHLWPAAF